MVFMQIHLHFLVYQVALELIIMVHSVNNFMDNFFVYSRLFISIVVVVNQNRPFRRSFEYFSEVCSEIIQQHSLIACRNCICMLVLANF